MDIYEFLKKRDLKNLLLNTTNEFLVEYNTLEENSLYKLTGFSGSTGQALVCDDKIYLFVDGRYHIQADLETDKSKVIVVKLNTWKDFWVKLLEILPKNSELALFSKKNSLNLINNFAKYYKVKLLDNDPFDENITNNFNNDSVSVDLKLTGMDTEQKVHEISHIADLASDEVIYVTDLDDVSYIFNMRNYSIPYSAKIRAKALVFNNRAELYFPEQFGELENFLKDTDMKVLINPNSINAYDAYILENSSKCKILDLDINPVQYLRTRKTDEEILHLKSAFDRTDRALGVVRDYIYSNDNISEYDIEQRLRDEFKNQGALGLSFKPIIAKDKNSALAHYSKSSKNEIIKDGSLVLIDCGAYFEGGLATDITRVFVKGKPTDLQKQIYTTVLKAFLLGFNSYNDNITGFEIDKNVREFLNSCNCEGFVFNHGLGHGIGINVHEAPPNLSNGDIAKVPIEENMCFTIEPGLYKEGDFGIRLENSCYFKDGKIHSFVHMNYEEKLIDYSMLSDEEKKQLCEFEVK